MRVTSCGVPNWPERPALFLDLDGTLLDFADEPAGVKVSARLRDLIGRLPAVTGGATAFVSGRELDDLDRLLAPHRFPLGAVHGIERRDSLGRTTRAVVDKEVLARLGRALRRFVARNPDTLLEDKGVTLALHYRKRPDLEEAVIREVESSLATLSSGLTALRGNRVVEVKPSGQNKGSAIVAFMQEPPFSGRTPVFIGDDVTDEDGFRTINALGGISVKVSSGDTAARWRLADIDAVLSWLETLVAGDPVDRRNRVQERRSHE